MIVRTKIERLSEFVIHDDNGPDWLSGEFVDYESDTAECDTTVLFESHQKKQNR